MESTITIREPDLAALEALARHEHLSVEEVLHRVVEQYASHRLSNADLLKRAARHSPPPNWYEQEDDDPFQPVGD